MSFVCSLQVVLGRCTNAVKTQSKARPQQKICTVSKCSSEKAVEVSRRVLLSAVPALSALLASPQPSSAGLFGGKSGLQAAFEKALAVQDDPVKLEAAWTECLAIAPDNAAVWSNRGTVRLGLKKYAEAQADLEKARDLEIVAYGYSSGFVLVALGNAKGFQGDYQGAIEDYEAALEDTYPGISTLAYASLSLAKFEIGKDKEAVENARKALDEAPEYADVQAALAGLLWKTGDKAGAKSMAEAIGGSDALRQFADAQEEANGWPPKTIAAVRDYLSA